jgi:hypothetical protein
VISELQNSLKSNDYLMENIQNGLLLSDIGPRSLCPDEREKVTFDVPPIQSPYLLGLGDKGSLQLLGLFQ